MTRKLTKPIHSLKIIFILLIMLACLRVWGQPQEFIAISSNPGKGLKIALLWDYNEDVVRYDLYRKGKMDLQYPDRPINVKSIRIMGDCDSIKTFLGEQSIEWKIVHEFLPNWQNKYLLKCNLRTILGEKGQDDTVTYNALLALSRVYYRIGIVIGLAFEDNNIVDGRDYLYKLIGFDAKQSEVVSFETNVIAGIFIKPPKPENLVAEEGDNQVMLTWESDHYTHAYNIYRSLKPILSNPGIKVNPGTAVTLLTNRLNKDTIDPNLPGFVDYQRFDEVTGMPISHKVGNIDVPGPENGTTYYYWVTAVDLFGREGDPSNQAKATPADSTPPRVPMIISVVPDEVNSRMEIKWNVVRTDISNHMEVRGVKSYDVYRYGSPDNPEILNQIPFASDVPQPKKDSIYSVTIIDATPELRVDNQDKTWYYRVTAKDYSGNVSSYSSALAGIMKDTTKPMLVDSVVAIGEEEKIWVLWKKNTDPDIMAYNVYQSICKFGKWSRCLGDTVVPHLEEEGSGKVPGQAYSREDTVCRNDFRFLGQITHDSVLRAIESRNYFIIDSTMDKKSPLCYAYWIKAVDSSGNTGGGYPLPTPVEIVTSIACQRLRDKTPPDPAILSGLLARDTSIEIEWMGPPTQDIYAYHVYRAKDYDKDYEFIAQVTVPGQKSGPSRVSDKMYKPAEPCNCDSIPGALNQDMTLGKYTDKKVQKKKIYWYKTVGVDWNGNEGDTAGAIGISTFTFSSNYGHSPEIITINQNNTPCGLKIDWKPAFNSSLYIGFAVFKSFEPDGAYFQVSQIISGNSYNDTNVVKGKKYYYRVAVIDSEGNLSELSDPKEGMINP